MHRQGRPGGKPQHLHRDAGQGSHFGDVLQLRTHEISASNLQHQRRLADNRVQPQRRLAGGQKFLARHQRLDPMGDRLALGLLSHGLGQRWAVDSVGPWGHACVYDFVGLGRQYDHVVRFGGCGLGEIAVE